MKYNKNGKNPQGNVLLIRHLPDDSIYRIKCNAVDGLALGSSNNPPMGWASILGKATYLEPGWDVPVGNYAFTLYVADLNEPGSGTDQVWLQTRDKGGKVVAAFSMPAPAAPNAVAIMGGNIVVPH